MRPKPSNPGEAVPGSQERPFDSTPQWQALFASAGHALRRRIERWAREDCGRRSPLGGSDLVELGFSGPAVGRTLARELRRRTSPQVVRNGTG